MWGALFILAPPINWPASVLGWDMGAALTLAQALGIDTLIAAELLPEIEAVMVRKLNEQIGENHG